MRVSAESTTSAHHLNGGGPSNESVSVGGRACRHSPLIARAWVFADKCAYAGVGDGILNVVKATIKAVVLRESYFSSEALCFHHCGLFA